MDVRMAYCSACDQEVRVALAPGGGAVTARGADAHDLVCLEYGARCTGDMCPLFQQPTDSMRERLARHRSSETAPPGPGRPR